MSRTHRRSGAAFVRALGKIVRKDRIASQKSKPTYMEPLEGRIMLSAPDWVVALQEGGQSQNPGVFVNAITSDDSTVTIGGSWMGETDYDPLGLGQMHTSTGTFGDAMIAQYDAADGTLEWTAKFGSTQNANIAALTSDDLGNIYFAGTFSGQVTINGSPVDSQGLNDIFFGMLSSNGVLQWSQTLGSANGEGVSGIALNADGDLLVAGAFGGTMDFDPAQGASNFVTLPGSNVSGYLGVYDNSTGAFLDLMTLQGTTSNTSASISDVAVAADGDVVFSANVSNGTTPTSTAVDFDLNSLDGTAFGTVSLPADSDTSDNFTPRSSIIGRVNATLDGHDFLNELEQTGFGGLSHIALDSNDNIFASGQLSPGTIDLDPTQAEFIVERTRQFTAPVVAGFNAAGEPVFGHLLDALEGEARDVTVIDNGVDPAQVIFSGYFGTNNTLPSIDFDPGAGSAPASSAQGNSSGDLFAWRFDIDGSFEGAAIIGAGDYDDGRAIYYDADHGLFVSGAYNQFGPSTQTVDFDLTAGTENRTGTGSFLALYDGDVFATNGVTGGGAGGPVAPVVSRNYTGFFNFGADVMVDSGSRSTLPVTIENTGTATTPGTLVELYASPDGTMGHPDAFYLGRAGVPPLAADSEREVIVPIIVPPSVAMGDFTIIGIVDGLDRVDETNENDNTFTSPNTVAITQPDYNLLPSIGGIVRLPDSIVETQAERGIVQVMIDNDGTATIPGGVVADTYIVARPVGGGEDIMLNLRGLPYRANVSGMRGETGRLYTIPISLPATLTEGTYDYVAIVDVNDALAETEEMDNEAVVEAPQLLVQPADIDINGTMTTLRPSANIVSGERNGLTVVRVDILNDSNVTLPVGLRVDVTLVARPTDAVDDSQDVVLKTQAANLSNLRIDQQRAVPMFVQIPSDLPIDEYNLVAIIDSGDDLAEDDETNNEAVDSEANAVSIADPFVDLSADLDVLRQPPAVVTGTETRMVAFASIFNNGNIPLDRGTTADLRILLSPGGDELAVVNDVNLSGLRPGTARRVPVRFVLPDTVTPGNYSFVLEIDTNNDVAETNEGNNSDTSGVTNVDDPFVDLDVSFNDRLLRLPDSVTSGAGTRILIPLLIANNGNIALERDAMVDVQIFGVEDLGSGVEHLLDTFENVRIPGIRPGTARAVNLPTDFPAGLADNDFRLRVVVDPVGEGTTGDIEESAEESNNIVWTPADEPINVILGEVDLAVNILDRAIVPAATTSGLFTSRVILPVEITNLGNVPTDRLDTFDMIVEAVPTNMTDPAVTVYTAENYRLPLQRPATSRIANLVFTLPPGLETNDYTFRVTVDPVGEGTTGDIVEREETSNNSASTTKVASVTEGLVNLGLTVNSDTIPNDVVQGGGGVYTVSVTVENSGTVPLPLRQRVNYTFFLRPENAVDDSQDVELLPGAPDQLLGLNPNTSRTLNFGFVLPSDPSDIAEGNYVVVAKVEAANSPAIKPEQFEAEAVGDDVVTVSEGFYNAAIELNSENIPASLVAGDGGRFVASVTVLNDGNLFLGSSSLADVLIKLRPDGGASDGSDDIVIGGLSAVNLNLGAEQSRNFNIPVTVPAVDPQDIQHVLSGDFTIVATVEPSSSSDVAVRLDDSIPGDNEDLGDTVSVTAAFFDPAVPILSDTIPPSLIAGAGGTYRVNFNIENLGNVPLTGTEPTNVFVALRPVGAMDASQDVSLGGLSNQNLNLPVGASRNYSVLAFVPEPTPEAQYNVVVRLEPSGSAYADDKPVNSEAVGNDTVNITAPFRNLAITLNSETIPPGLVAGAGGNYLASVTVSNLGNVALQAGQLITLQAELIPTMGGDSIVIGQITDQAIALAANGSRNFNIPISVPQSVPEDSYNFVVRVSSANFDLMETLADNTDGNDDVIEVDEGFYNLGIELNSETLPDDLVAGVGSFTSSVRVNNLSNIVLPTGQQVDITAVLRPTGAADNTQDVQVGQLTNQLMTTAVASGKDFTVPLSVPIQTPEDDYDLVFIVNPTDALTERTVADNEVVAAVDISVTAAFVDLAIDYVSDTIPASLLAGSGEAANVVVNIENQSNVALSNADTMTITIKLRPTGGGNDVEIASTTNVPINLAINASKDVTVPVSVPVSTNVDEYVIVVEVQPNSLTDVDLDDNVEVTAETVIVDEGSNDLDITTATHNFSSPAETGDNANATIRITNVGTVPAVGNVDIEVFATTNGVIDGDSVSIGTNTGQALNLAANATSANILVPVTIPAELDTDTYTLVARVATVSGIVDDNAVNDDQTFATTVNVQEVVNGSTLFGTLTLTQTTVLPIGPQTTSEGDVDSTVLGNGTYDWIHTTFLNGEGRLGLIFGGDTLLNATRLLLDFNGAAPSTLNGRQIVFQETAAGSSGSYSVEGSLFVDGQATTVSGFFRII